MRACIQRVTQATVTIANETVGEIGPGMVVLLGIAHSDTEADALKMAQKIAQLRIFDDSSGNMNLSIEDTSKEVMVVSQFTLFGDCRKGRRPSFIDAAPPELACQLYQRCIEELRRLGLKVETGQFRQHMEVALVNDGPVTLLLDTHKLF